MKKVISVLLVALLVLSLSTAALATESATLSVSSVTAQPGEEVTLTFSISEATFATYGATIVYDSSALTLTSVTSSVAGMFVPNLATGAVGLIGVADITVNGPLFTATFTVAEDAVPGTYSVSVVVDNFTKADGVTALSVGSVAGGVTIPCTEHSFGEWTVTTPATCEAEGVETRTCEYCGFAETRAIAALGHAWGEWTVTTPATCEDEGVETRVCANCGEEETRAIEALGHTAGEAYEYDDEQHWHLCTVCGEAVEHAAHVHGEWIIDSEYNEETEEFGTMHKVCVCGHTVYGEVGPVPPTGDMTAVVAFGGICMISLLAAAAFVFKRKAA